MLDLATPTTAHIIERCEALFSDLHFEAQRAWKAAKPGRKVIGFLPYYAPRELVHAAGCLPIAILGGGDQLEVIHGDAYYQSYICRIPRSTIELGVSARLDFVDGMLFPSICDVIRNLSGMWKLMFPQTPARYLDLPQNFSPDIGVPFYAQELKELREFLEHIVGRPIADDDIRASIALFNENRRLVREVYQLRADMPWNLPASEVYLLMRAGLLLPVEEHNAMLVDYMRLARQSDRPMKDNSRIVLSGVFCEQPPLNLIKSIELAGCYIVDDDFLVVNRWEKSEVATQGDPLENLSRAYINDSKSIAPKYEPNVALKGKYLVDSVRENGAEGVIFAMPSFCDPALLDRPMLQAALKAANIPYIGFKYAENTGQMQPVREQAGTFADSIKLWSGQ
ncbi:benzoyl-CoA reductase subunit C [Rhodoblastus sphagnicola]|uniref:Benzoyl-CoA reductase subunit C n=1 Tax=Rhodoblastus sphagnicola TaxID=333368 RepID=A0A2S6MX55_9HYPH|nr:benzoyl-CoA reductase subunit C [Rhodoblastus sphagnicola]MBB4199272.1 benzoyl-CoA reductase subunit C [Rhodoblastus sphagnicola]PPQ26941.1 benzoyl-CoA reductase subunit C [Rhodoblastus sphagnicola]